MPDGHDLLTHRPRVLHLTTTDVTQRFLLLNQLRMFQAAGFEVSAMSAPGPWRRDIEQNGIRFIPWESATRAWAPKNDLRAFRELRDVLATERFDIVHTHNPKPGVLGRIASRVVGVPAVVNTVHGLYAAPDDRSLSRKALLGIEWMAGKFSDFELYQSAEDLARARRIKITSAQRSAYLGNGIDLQRFDPERIDASAVDRLRSEHEIPDGALVVGMVGRLVREKGWPEFAEAARIVRAARRDVVFLAIGPSDEQKSDRITPRDVQGWSDAVRFCGEILEMPEILATLDLFVLPSHREGFPRSAIEAAAMGLPLVLTDIRGCREVVPSSEHGLLVPPRDPARLADAILSLLADEGRRRAMGEANRARATIDFDERTIVRRTLAVYDRLLSHRSRNGHRRLAA